MIENHSVAKNNLRVTVVFVNILLAVFFSIGVVLSDYAYLYVVPITTFYIVWSIYLYRQLQLFVLFLIYLSIYFYYLYPYFYWNIQLSEYSDFQNIANYNEIALIFFLFYCGTITSAILWPPHGGRLARIGSINYSKIGEITYMVTLLTCLVLTMRQGVNVIGVENSYDAYRSNLENSNSLPLITILVFFFFPFKSGKPKYPVLFWFIGIIIIFFCITRGFRMVLAPYGLLMFYWFFDGRIRFRTLLIFAMIGFIGFLGVNALKMNIQLELNNALSESNTGNYIISHHADNLYVASAGIGLLREGHINFLDKILLNAGFFSEAMVPPSLLPDICKYPHIITKYVPTGGGGLFVVGAYFMWGEIGVWLFGLALSKLIIEAYSKNNLYLNIIIGVVLIFSPRWTSYDFHVILRFPVLALIIFLILCDRRKY